MIHRFLHVVLESGRDAILADPGLLEDLFDDNYTLDPAEVEAVKEYFAEHPPEVVNGYARQNTKFPAWAVILNNEVEAISFLGDQGGIIDDPEDEFYQADIESAIWSYAYHILTYSENPDVTAWYYEICKLVLLAGLKYLTDKGCMEYRMTGLELAPDPKYIPEHLFVRRLTFECQRPFERIDRLSRLQKAFQVSGIHIDKSGSPRDVGGVKTKVTLFGVGEDG